LLIRKCGGSSCSDWAPFAWQNTGSSNRIARMAFLTVPPSLDAGEITDKGSINQRAMLRHRAAVVDALYTTPAPPVGGCGGCGGIVARAALAARNPGLRVCDLVMSLWNSQPHHERSHAEPGFSLRSIRATDPRL
jgi:hypothetical protein